jgi:hypothetical protein
MPSAVFFTLFIIISYALRPFHSLHSHFFLLLFFLFYFSLLLLTPPLLQIKMKNTYLTQLDYPYFLPSLILNSILTAALLSILTRFGTSCNNEFELHFIWRNSSNFQPKMIDHTWPLIYEKLGKYGQCCRVEVTFFKKNLIAKENFRE